MKKIIVITFIWIGFVGAISFMESWLKFQAPNMTTELGLGIGQLVFRALNIMEIIFLISISVHIISLYNKESKLIHYSFLIVVAIILIQTTWLLPILNERAEKIIQGITVSKSNAHLIYILLEVIKIVCLFIFGIKLLKKLTVQNE
ncbi:hypothetical protein DS884_13575 [Tenacibaculum sp. E3R01]|uniref:hypothetical protein n=1 Tax=Tenacibaculum sp. E3R01 TaxID=2267227 RepID=UPI000DEBE30B|nr:hypothetical protein [Tenacibaculum sp. E3R01]RBW56493.1 hypothetical protein DS884_13575 [Tenacibaculum sp. E3R01]